MSSATHNKAIVEKFFTALNNGDVVWMRYLPNGNNAEIIRIRE